MGVLEARQEGQRRWVAERNERLEAEAAALAEKQAAAAEAERFADRDRRREEARQDARLNYITKVAKPTEAAGIAANAARSAFAACVADPKATVEKLFAAYSEMQSAVAAHAVLSASVERYTWPVTHPGQEMMPKYLDRTPQATFNDILSQVVASRSAAAASTAQVPNEVFSKADQAGDEAAKAVEA